MDQWFHAGESEHEWTITEIDYDGHNATDLAIHMCEERNNEDFCVEIPQTAAGQNLAVKGFRELLLQGKLVIEENPLFLWCLGNAIEITNNFGDIKLNKKHKDDTERIDPVAAAMNALARRNGAEKSSNPIRCFGQWNLENVRKIWKRNRKTIQPGRSNCQIS